MLALHADSLVPNDGEYIDAVLLEAGRAISCHLPRRVKFTKKISNETFKRFVAEVLKRKQSQARLARRGDWLVVIASGAKRVDIKPEKFRERSELGRPRPGHATLPCAHRLLPKVKVKRDRLLVEVLGLACCLEQGGERGELHTVHPTRIRCVHVLNPFEC